MPQVVRGSRAEGATGDAAISPSALAETRSPFELDRQPSAENTNTQPDHSTRTFQGFSHPFSESNEQAVASPSPHRHVAFRVDSNDPPSSPQAPRNRRRSSSFFRNNSETRPEEEAYYDSRAATKREFRRRATTLEDYYHENPDLLPQLPFTWHRGKKRWRLISLIVFMWIDACVIPIALYYGMHYGGIEGWIIFAVVTTIWGGPTYLEFGVRTFKLMKKERFYRPLGTTSRWCFDYLNLVSTLSIFTVTLLFIVGSAPHIVWLRVLCMPMPALLYCLGILAGFPTLYHKMGWKAPFRLSSTAKGVVPRPGVYYFIEDTVAVNANAGRPYREALAARYDASPRFRRMIYIQSVFWSIPPIIIAIPLTIIAVIHPIPPNVAYAICWAVPYIWATIWGLVSLRWCKRDMIRERKEWEADRVPNSVKDITLDEDRSSPVQPAEEKPDITPERVV